MVRCGNGAGPAQSTVSWGWRPSRLIPRSTAEGLVCLHVFFLPAGCAVLGCFVHPSTGALYALTADSPPPPPPPAPPLPSITLPLPLPPAYSVALHALTLAAAAPTTLAPALLALSGAGGSVSPAPSAASGGADSTLIRSFVASEHGVDASTTSKQRCRQAAVTSRVEPPARLLTSWEPLCHLELPVHATAPPPQPAAPPQQAALVPPLSPLRQVLVHRGFMVALCEGGRICVADALDPLLRERALHPRAGSAVAPLLSVMQLPSEMVRAHECVQQCVERGGSPRGLAGGGSWTEVSCF